MEMHATAKLLSLMMVKRMKITLTVRQAVHRKSIAWRTETIVFGMKN